MFSQTFFTAHTYLGFRKCLIGMLFDRKPDKLLTRIRVAAHVIFKIREEDVMYDALFAPLSNYRESQQAYKTLSCIKTQPEEMALAPLKPRSDEMEPSEFDTCEICINYKITHKQDTKLYIIKKRSLMLVFEPLSLHYSSKRYNQRVCAPYRLSHEAI